MVVVEVEGGGCRECGGGWKVEEGGGIVVCVNVCLSYSQPLVHFFLIPSHLHGFSFFSLSFPFPSSPSSSSLSLPLSPLRCADIGHPLKPTPLHLKWSEGCMEEFYNQGDNERSAGLAISPCFDRYNKKEAKSQKGFLDFLVRPQITCFSEVVGNDFWVKYLDINDAYWGRLLDYANKSEEDQGGMLKKLATIRSTASSSPSGGEEEREREKVLLQRTLTEKEERRLQREFVTRRAMSTDLTSYTYRHLLETGKTDEHSSFRPLPSKHMSLERHDGHSHNLAEDSVAELVKLQKEAQEKEKISRKKLHVDVRGLIVRRRPSTHTPTNKAT